MTDLNRFYITNGAAAKSLLRCTTCNDDNHVWSTQIGGMTLEEIVLLAEAHDQVYHNRAERQAQNASESAWKAATDDVKKDVGDVATDISDAAERALRAAAVEFLPVVSKFLSRFK